MSKKFERKWTKEGPKHDALHRVTAVCNHSLCDEAVMRHCFFFPRIYTTIRGVSVGVRHNVASGLGATESRGTQCSGWKTESVCIYLLEELDTIPMSNAGELYTNH